MSDSDEILDSVIIMRLVEAGRFKDASELLAGHWPELKALISYRWKREIGDAYDQVSASMAGVLRGWKSYYRAEYAEAAGHFRKALESERPWIRAWAAIGMAKAATDTGFLKSASEWCILASALARHYEMGEHHSAAAGALGEVLLRGFYNAEALAAFDMDLALLPVGAYYRGRILCYRAHAYSRLGPECRCAAEVAYRLAVHTPAERTDAYALAGVCLMAVEYGDVEFFNDSLQRLESVPSPELSPAHAWGRVCKARMVQLDKCGGNLDSLCRAAYNTFPPEYHFERIWTLKWSGSLGIQIAPEQMPESSDDKTRFNPEIPSATGYPDWGLVTAFDLAGAECDLLDTGFTAHNWGEATQEIWQERRRFMP